MKSKLMLVAALAAGPALDRPVGNHDPREAGADAAVAAPAATHGNGAVCARAPRSGFDKARIADDGVVGDD